MCPTTFQHRPSIHATKKIQQLYEVKMVRGFLKIFEMEQQKTLAVQEPEFWSEKQF